MFTVNGDDYTQMFENIEFEVGETRKCVNVNIIEDATEEGPECFSGEILRGRSLDSRIVLDPALTTIEIKLDNGTYLFLCTVENLLSRHSWNKNEYPY